MSAQRRPGTSHRPDALWRRSESALHVDRTLPFELRALEAALVACVRFLELAAADVEKQVAPSLDRLAHKVGLLLISCWCVNLQLATGDGWLLYWHQYSRSCMQSGSPDWHTGVSSLLPASGCPT